MKRRSKEEWQELILSQTESGLSAQQFCRNNDVCPKYFSIRKKQLVLRHGGCCLYFDAMPDATWLAQLVRGLA